jgi:8-oxo-dGTP pyrophosphatase MutT (NUDIX family)
MPATHRPRANPAKVGPSSRIGTDLIDEGTLQARLAQRLARRDRGVRPEWDVIPAAVLVPLYIDRGEWHVLYTRRTDTVDVHRGQVSFPGGRIDPEDAGPLQAALREADEEVGIRAQDVEVLGMLGPLLTVTQFEVTPVIGRIAWPYPLRLNTHEVACAFGVPLRWLSDPAHVQRTLRQPPIPGREILVYTFEPFLGETIWGATARITLDLVAIWRSLAPI